ncbi:MAG: AAA family ATPase [Bacteroidaceae bacterium]|nr:AAA family ATPase [Bacteroidaceae bacterium]MBR2249734.1 AAA family ATPase [Prevotella sp.]
MENIYRLIDGFCKQSRATIERHLDRLADNYAVYSEHLKGISPHLENNDISVYVHNACIVVVCVDNYANKDELADEEIFNGEAPIYFTESSHRISPVWKLQESIRLMKIKLREAHIDSFALWGVLLSESKFLNADDMKDAWEDKDITVFDDLKDLKKWKIGVNTDEDLPYGPNITSAIESITKRPAPQAIGEHSDTEADSLLQEMVDDFIKSQINEDADSEEATGNGENNDAADIGDDEDNDIGTATTGSLQGAGFIEPSLEDVQNNLKAKVTILHPQPNPRAELDKLVGCTDIKARIDELLALNRYNAMVSSAFPGAKTHQVSLHSIFLGRPGTGKTTVCKIFGSLLHEAGALSKGHVVVANRGTFVGSRWGDEETNVRCAIELARGGVLMIDEAYQLASKHENDPGRLVLQLLMELLADEKQRDIAVVLCGYKEPMIQLLETNQGLESRFPNRFEFNDFTIEELIEITTRRIGEYRYSFTEPAWQKFKDVIEAAYKVRDPQSWGNARFVANQLERIYIEHAQRCVRESPADCSQLLQLTTDDIKPIDVPRPRLRIGF